MLRKFSWFGALLLLTSCAGVGAVTAPPGVIHKPAGDIIGNEFSRFLVKAFVTFKETEDIDRTAAQLGWSKGRMDHLFPVDMKVQTEYLPKIAISIFFPGMCIDPDGIIRDIEISGFGRGYVGLPDYGKGVPRRYSFLILTPEKDSLNIDINLVRWNNCVDSIVLQ